MVVQALRSRAGPSRARAAPARSGRPRPASAARRSSGAASGSPRGREGHRAARLAHDELARPRRRRRGSSTASPSRPPGGRDLAQRDRRSRRSPGRWGRSASASADGAPARVGRLDRRPARACRRAAALADRAASRSPSSCAPSPRHGHPLLARSEVVHVAEHDVGHRRPVRHRDRQRVVGQAALGVQRAVDRVDPRRALVGRRSRPSRAPRRRREPRALVVQALELGEHQRPRPRRRSRA